MLSGLAILFSTAALLVVILGSAALAWRLTHPPRRTAGVNLARHEPAGPEDLGVEYQTFPLPERLGEAWAIRGHNDRGPVLLLFHGWADSKYGLLLRVAQLQPFARSLVLFDLPGHGESPSRRFTWGVREPDALAEAIGKVHETLGGPLVLLGYSAGASLAIRCGGVTGVSGVIADSPYRWPSDVTRRTLWRMRLPGWPLADLAFLGMAMVWPRLRASDTLQDAGALARPLCVIHGADDGVVPPDHARALANAAPHGELHLFPEADHLEPADLAADAYAEVIEGFLARVATPAERH